MKHPRLKHDRPKHAGRAFAAGLALFVSAAAPAAAQDYDISLPPAAAEGAQVHVLLVRHAVAACGDLQCDLTEEGRAQADELARLVDAAGLRLAGVFASSACRTALTVTPAADAIERPVQLYPARDDLPVCGYLGGDAGDGVARPGPAQRPVAGLTYAADPARSRDALIAWIDFEARRAHEFSAGRTRPRMYLAADHSNFVCAWFRALDVPEADYAGECVSDGGLDETDFADIYWLYYAAGEGRWRLYHAEDVLDRDSAEALDP